VTTPPPTRLRIGHLTYTVTEDDAAVAERSVSEHGDYAAYSRQSTQQIVLGTRQGQDNFGADYRAENLLHEVLHSCLRVAACDPDRDAKAGVEDVEERTVSALAGVLLATLRDNPDLPTWLTNQ
jgi:hypothetical protein